MLAPRRANYCGGPVAKSDDKTDDEDGFVGEIKGLATLLQDYAKQETVGPLKGVGRYVAFGLAGSILLSLAGVMFVMAGLRALQTQTGTALTGNLSWIPYLIMVVGAALIILLAVKAVLRDPDEAAS